MITDLDKKPQLDPARTIVEKLGGPAAAANIVGRAQIQAYRWMWPKDQGGTGGKIPRKPAEKILAWARAHNKDIGPGDFFA